MDNLRKKFVSLRLTEQEYDELKEMAYQAKMTVSDYIRNLIFGYGKDEKNELI